MTADIKGDVDINDGDAEDGSDITEQEYADARARYAALPPDARDPEMFGRVVSGGGVVGDTLYGSDDTTEGDPDDAD